MTTPLTYVLSRMLSDVPMLLVYIGGMGICGAMWRRASLAAMLCLIGLAVMLAGTLGSAAFYGYLIQNRGNTSAQSLGVYLSLFGIGFSLVRACGLGLVVAGVFAQRQRDERGFDVQGGQVLPPMNGYR